MEELLNVFVEEEHEDEDIEEAVLFHLINHREGRRRNINDRLNLELMSPHAIKINFRFQREHIVFLAESLRLPAVIRTRNVVSGVEGLCILLRRLAYPNRLKDLEKMFGLSAQSISQISNKLATLILANFGHVLENLDNVVWLNRERLVTYSQAITNAGAPIRNCWGFIDGTVRGICRPKRNQQEYYSGHKRLHCVKYQSVITPDGAIFRDSEIYDQLQRNVVFQDRQYVLYGDQGYGIRELLLVPNWLDIKKFLYFHTMTFIFKMNNNILPNYLTRQLLPITDIHLRNKWTANKNIFYVKRTAKSSSMKSLFHKGVVEFNLLP